MKRHPLLTAAASVAVLSGGLLLSPVALAADQPSLTCVGLGFACAGPTSFGSASASYATDQPAPVTVWADAQVSLLESPVDALDVDPGSTVTRTYEVTIASQVSPDSPRRVSLLIKNRSSVFAFPLDMSLHITDSAGTRLPGGTCTPAEYKLNVSEQTTVTCTVPEGGTRLTAFRRGNYGDEQLAAWALGSQTPPAPAAPGSTPVVTVDGQSLTGTVDADGVWRATATITRQAPGANSAQATHTPEVIVDGTSVTAPSFRVTTKAAPAPTPSPTAPSTSPTAPSTSPSSSATASATATGSTTAAAVTASSRPSHKGSETSTTRLAVTGPHALGVLTCALLLVGAGALSLGRARRA